MSKNIIVTSQDPGGASAVLPVAKNLFQEGFEVIALNYGKGAEVFGKGGLPLTDLNNFGVESPSERGFDSSEPLEKILKKTDAKILIGGTGVQMPAYSIDRAAMLAASTRCPSVAVLDLWQNYAERFRDPHNGRAILPTRIAIMDQIARKDMLEEGFPDEILEVTGNPFFDSLSIKANEFDTEKRNDLRNKLGLSDYFVVTFFSGPVEASFGNRYGFNERDSFRTLLESLSRFPDSERERIKVVLKMHPREDPKNLDGVVSDYPQLKIIKDSSDTREVVLTSDVNTSYFSTVLYESISMGKIALAIQPGVSPENERQLFTHKFREYIPILRNSEALYQQINNIKNDPTYKEEMVRKMGNVLSDGKSGERVKSLIYRLIG